MSTTYIVSSELCHHGILGMKWGVRRYQNADGSLTSAGRKRYGASEDQKKRIADASKDYKNINRAYNAAVNYGDYVRARQLKGSLDKAQAKLDFEKREAKNEVYRQKIDSKKKSKSRVKYEEEYMGKGYSKEEAEIAAYKRERTKKIIAATAGLSVAAAAAYVAYRHYDRNVDSFIKSGDVLKRVAQSDSASVRDAFYAATGKDANKYVGLYGKSILDSSGNVFQKSIQATKDIKVASEKTAHGVLKDMVESNPTYKKEVVERLKFYNSSTGLGEKQRKTLHRALQSIQSGNVDRNVYDAFNLALGGSQSNAPNQHVREAFYKELKNRGYGAIKDVNDRRLSGYGAKTAKIIFDASSTKVSDVRKLSASDVGKAYQKEINKALGKQTIKSLPAIALYAAPGAAIYGATKSSVNNRNRAAEKEVVRNYRAEHPNSELKDTDIIRNYYNRK